MEEEREFQIEMQLNEAEKTIAALELVKKHLNEQLGAQKNEKNELLQKIEKLNDEKRVSERERSKNLVKLSGLDNENKELKKNFDEITFKYQRLSTDYKENMILKDKEIAILQRDTHAFSSKILILEIDLDKYKRIVEGSERRLKTFTENIEKEKLETEEFYKSKIEECEKSSSKIRALQNDLETTVNSKKKADVECEALKISLSEKIKLLEEFEAKYTQVQNNHLKEIEDKLGNIYKIENTLNEKSVELASTLKKLEEADLERKELKLSNSQERENWKKSLEEKDNIIAEKNSQNAQLYAELQSERKLKQHNQYLDIEMEMEIDQDFKSQLIDLQKKYNSEKDQRIRIQTELSFLKEELSKKIPLLESRKKEYETIVTSYNDIRKKLDLAVRKNNKMNEDLLELGKQKDQAQRDLQLVKANSSQMATQIDALLLLNESLKRKLNSNDPLADVFKYSLENFNKANLREEDLREIQSIASLRETNEHLRLKLNQLEIKPQLSDESQEIKGFKAKIEDLESSLKVMEREIQKRDEEIKKHEENEKVRALIFNSSALNPAPINNAPKQPTARNTSTINEDKFSLEKYQELLYNINDLKEQNRKLDTQVKSDKIENESLLAKIHSLKDKTEEYDQILKKLSVMFSEQEEMLKSSRNETDDLRRENTVLRKASTGFRRRYLGEKNIREILDQENKSMRTIMENSLIEKEKNFQAFLTQQEHYIATLEKKKQELLKVDSERKSLMEELHNLRGEYQSQVTSLEAERIRNMLKLENLGIILFRSEKEIEILRKIISELEAKLKELAQERSKGSEFDLTSIEEKYLHSSFVKLDDRGFLNTDEIKESLINQKLQYEDTTKNLKQNLELLINQQVLLEDKYEQLNKKYNDDCTEYQRQLDQQRENHETKLGEALEKLERELNKEKPKYSDIEYLEMLEKYNKLNEENNKIQADLEKSKTLRTAFNLDSDKNKNKISELNNEINKLKDDILKKNEELRIVYGLKVIKDTSLETEVEYFRRQIEFLNGRDDKLSEENRILNEKYSKMASIYGFEIEKGEQPEADKDSMADENLCKIEKDLKLSTAFEEEKKRRLEIQTVLKERDAYCKKLENQLNVMLALKAQYTELPVELKDPSTNEYEKEIQTLKDKIEALEIEKTEAKEELRNLNEDLEGRSQKIRELEANYKKLEGNFKSLEESYNNLINETKLKDEGKMDEEIEEKDGIEEREDIEEKEGMGEKGDLEEKGEMEEKGDIEEKGDMEEKGEFEERVDIEEKVIIEETAVIDEKGDMEEKEKKASIENELNNLKEKILELQALGVEQVKQLENAKEEITTLNITLDESQQKNKGLNDTLEDSQQKYRELFDTYEGSQQKINELNDKIIKIEEEYTQKIVKLESDYSQKIKLLEQDLGVDPGQFANLETEILFDEIELAQIKVLVENGKLLEVLEKCKNLLKFHMLNKDEGEERVD